MIPTHIATDETVIAWKALTPFPLLTKTPFTSSLWGWPYEKELSWKNSAKFRDFNEIRTHRLFISAAVLYQLRYENPYIGSRSIC